MKNNMKRFCDVPGCNKASSKTISLHKIPENDIEKQKWKEILQIDNQNKSLFICSRHFVSKDFTNTGKYIIIKIGSCFEFKIKKFQIFSEFQVTKGKLKDCKKMHVHPNVCQVH